MSRLLRCLVSCTAFALPLVVFWALIVQNARTTDTPPSPSRIPSPAKMTTAMNPIDALVYANPWFAGTLWFWLILWGSAGVALALLAILLPRSKGQWSLAIWGLCSLTLGVLCAGPWIYGLCF